MKKWKVRTYALFRLDDGQLPEVTIETIQAETAEEALQIAADHFAGAPRRNAARTHPAPHPGRLLHDHPA